MNLLESSISVQEAWTTLLGQVVDDGAVVEPVRDASSVGSQFGRETRGTRELRVAGSWIRHPRDRWVVSGVRGYRVEYAIALVVHALSRSRSIAPLLFYNRSGARFSDDGSTLNSAIGPRIFGGESTPLSQFEAALDRLQSDPASRRAYLQVFLPQDVIEPTRDVSCTGALHFLVRGGCLEAIGQMRSQSVLMVLPYDLFLLTMLQELASVRLGIPLGGFAHVCNSAHVYEDELPLARAVLADSGHRVPAMPPMTPEAVRQIPDLVRVEQAGRVALALDPRQSCRPWLNELTPYWRDLLNLMWGAWKRSNGVPLDENDVEQLPDDYRQLLIGLSDTRTNRTLATIAQ
ncbi:MAG: thymidylate synthase [Planctomycetales bacterium]